jgi:hypothetical protein
MNRLKRHRVAGRTLISAVIVFLVSATGLVISSGPAAAASCFGYPCHGKDPINAGCAASDSKTVTGHYGKITNYYSGGCKANWASGSVTLAGVNYVMEVVITTTDSRGSSESMCFPGPSDTGALHEYCYIDDFNYTYGYSDMVDGSNVTAASVYVYRGDGVLVEHDEADF